MIRSGKLIIKLRVLAISLCMFVSVLFHLNPDACADSFMNKLVDPSDGMLDAGSLLLEHSGFLPVPMFITEPAVGYGLGLGLIFFHESITDKAARLEKESQETGGTKEKLMLPPSVSGIMGLKTENDTWAGGGFHFGSWKKDHIRYLGGVTKYSANLTFYGKSENLPIKDGLDYNLDGWAVLQEIKFRVEDSNVFVGGRVTYVDTKSRFDIGRTPIGIEDWEFNYDNLGIGFVFAYDSRDNVLTPGSGIYTDVSTMFYSGSGPASTVREYQITDLANRAYWKIKPRLGLGWRVSGSFSTGSVPFYALPYIKLRGIPAMRYQGSHALETEIETTYQVTDRWGLVGFGGVGRSSDSLSDFGGNSSRWAGGIGFRYLIARVMGLHSGIDIARGPEDWVVYIQVGSGL